MLQLHLLNPKEKKWIKYSFVCPDCDSLIEYTCNEFDFPSGSVMDITCVCGGNATLMSVVNATIIPTNKKEEQIMETTTAPEYYNPNQIISYKSIEGDTTFYPVVQITDLEYQIHNSRQRIANLENILSNYSSQLNQITDQLSRDGWYDDSIDKDDVLTNLCEIIDYEPKKEISFTATITVTGRMDVRIGEDVSDLLDGIEFSLDTYNGDVIIDNYETYSIEED